MPFRLNEVSNKIWLFLAFNLIFWWVFALITQNAGPLHGDMLEAYNWSQNPSLGYYKHPPFWAWIAALWFAVLPVANWAFLLLCSVNVAIGLAAIWKLITRYCVGERRDLAFLLIFLTPFYTFLTFQYNANTIFYSLWPCTLYFFLKSLDGDGRFAAWLFGLFGAFMLLSKYSAIFLLLTCLVASLYSTRRKIYYASSAPYISITVMVALCAPHLYWLIGHDFQPLTYVEGRLHNSLWFTIGKAFAFIFGVILQNSLVIMAVFAALIFHRGQFRQTVRLNFQSYDRQLLLLFAFAPVLFTLLSGIAVSIKLSTNLTNAFLFLVPLTLTYLLSVEQVSALLPKIRKAVIGVFMIAIVAAPVASYVMFKITKERVSEPLVEVAMEAQAIWSSAFSTPLKIVTSKDGSADPVSFYAKDHPEQWTDMDFAKAPWISEGDLCRDGVMGICAKGASNCVDAITALTPNKAQIIERVLHRTYFGMQVQERAYSFILVPPDYCQK